jgi:hypothetical protein
MEEVTSQYEPPTRKGKTCQAWSVSVFPAVKTTAFPIVEAVDIDNRWWHRLTPRICLEPGEGKG